MSALGLVLVLVFAGWPRRARRALPDRSRSPSAGHRARFDGPPLLAMSGVVAGLLLASPFLVVVAPLLAGGWWRERLRRRRRRHSVDRRNDLSGFVDRCTEGLRAGHPLGVAVAAAARRSAADGPPRHPVVVRIAAGLAAGRELADAFDVVFGDDEAMAGDERLVVATMVALAHTGAAATASLERAGDTLRERADWTDALRTQAQQALSSAAVMSVLPFLFGLAAAIADPAIWQFYRGSWLGAACGGLAHGLMLLGWEWQQHLLGGEAR